MIKVFIVTYNNKEDLDNNIRSLLASDITEHSHEITVINNYGTLLPGPGFRVINNAARPDFSTGHLARNWNQALIHGFVSLKKPEADIVVTAQDDTIFQPKWTSHLLNLHRQYSFIAAGVGDALCSYTPDAVKTIGLWDERFCNIGYQEADYFLRAVRYNGEKSSINDVAHQRLHNEIEGNFFYGTFDPRGHGGNNNIMTVPAKNTVRDTNHRKSSVFHDISEFVYKSKWGETPHCYWPKPLIPPIVSKCPNYIFYPYFECDVEHLSEMNYVLPEMK